MTFHIDPRESPYDPLRARPVGRTIPITHLRLAAVSIIALAFLPAAMAGVDNRVENGDFERAGDDPEDIPNWRSGNRAALAIRADGVGSERDATLALLGGNLAVSDPPFPVTTGEAVHFSVDMRVVTGSARAIVTFSDVMGRPIAFRQYSPAAGADWTTVGEAAIVVPAGALYGTVTLESFSSGIASQNALALFDNVHLGN